MAGGKETPRQKMIGMMYLILTALLALNVSKQIIQAFVTIDKNTQTSNSSQFQRGTAAISELKSIASDQSEPARQKIAQKWLKVVNKINQEAAERIKLIDEIKVDIMKHCGEDVKLVTVTPYNSKFPTKPAVFDLDKIKGKDKFDQPMHLMIGSDIKRISKDGEGLKLWNSLKDYTHTISELVANWSEGSGQDKREFKFKAPTIGDLPNGKESEEVLKIVDKAIKSGKVQPDDKTAIRRIYGIMVKDERVKAGETEGAHWMGRTFDHAPQVAALAMLSSMQNEVLNARAIAIKQIRSRVGGGQYSFNQIMPLAYGPEFVNQGDSVTLEVLMAAYDSYKMPKVSYSLNDTTTDGKFLSDSAYSNGKGFVSFRASGTGNITVSGKVGIQNKSGVWKYRKWRKDIQVVKPSGTVSLPEMNVLYRGYKNIVKGGATGFPSFRLNGASNVSLSKEGDHYVAKPGRARKAAISVTGVSASGKSTNLGSFEFRVKNMPKADLYLGALGPDMSAPSNVFKAQSRLFAKYGPGIPLNATFRVVKWKLTISGAPQPVGGNGNVLSAKARSYLRQVRKGTIVQLTAYYTEPSGRRVKKVGSWTVQ